MDIVEKVNEPSPWKSPAFIVPKKDGDIQIEQI